MPVALLDPAQKYLRRMCGLATAPRPAVIEADPDDPANRLLTTAEAAKAAHVPETTIRDWAAERKDRPALLHPAGRDAAGRPLYRELDVLTVEAQTRRTARTLALAREALEGLDTPLT